MSSWLGPPVPVAIKNGAAKFAPSREANDTSTTAMALALDVHLCITESHSGSNHHRLVLARGSQATISCARLTHRRLTSNRRDAATKGVLKIVVRSDTQRRRTLSKTFKQSPILRGK